MPVVNSFKQLNTLLCNVPSALAGLALAIGSMTKCWGDAINSQDTLQVFGAVIAFFLLLPIILKYLLNRQLLIQDLQHPLMGSVLPTLPMAIMVFSGNISAPYLQIATVLSWLAILLHMFFFIYFTLYQSKHFNFNQILPSWFIPPIGLVLPIITHPGGLPIKLAEILLLFGLLSYAVLLPIVLWRLAFSKPLTDNEKPIIVILATPASLLLLGYFEVVPQPHSMLVFILLVLALLMTLSVYFSLIKLVKLPFYLTYSAFTFPLVVSATALFKTRDFLFNGGFPELSVILATYLARIELIIATVMVCYVSLRFYRHFKKQLRTPVT